MLAEGVAAGAADDWIDLADRAGDGIAVVRLWSRSTRRVKVRVTHLRSGRWGERDVPPADALVAFHHPFAYVTPHDPAAAGAVATEASTPVAFAAPAGAAIPQEKGGSS